MPRSGDRGDRRVQNRPANLEIWPQGGRLAPAGLHSVPGYVAVAVRVRSRSSQPRNGRLARWE